MHVHFIPTNLAMLLAPCIYYCLDSGYVPLSHVAQALPLLPCLRTLQVLPPTCHHLGTQAGPVGLRPKRPPWPRRAVPALSLIHI